MPFANTPAGRAARQNQAQYLELMNRARAQQAPASTAPAAAPQSAPAPAPAASTAAPTDSVTLSPQAQAQNTGTGPIRMTAEAWQPGQSAETKSTLSGMLLSAGYSQDDLYAKDENGRSLVDRVAESNGLANPNLIQVGQELTIPRAPAREEAAEAAEASPTPAATAAQEAQSDNPSIATARTLQNGASAIRALEGDRAPRDTNSFSDRGLDRAADLRNSLGMLDRFESPESWTASEARSLGGRPGLQRRRREARTQEQFETLYGQAPEGTHEEKVSWVRNLVTEAYNFDRNNETMKDSVEKMNRESGRIDSSFDIYRARDFAAYQVLNTEDSAA